MACEGGGSVDARHALRGVVPLLVTAVVLTACSSGTSSSTPAAAASKPATSDPAGASAGGSPGNGVDDLHAVAKDFSFTLDRTTLHPGKPGVDAFLKNEGQAPHTLTFYSDAAFTTKIPGADSGQVRPGDLSGFPLSVPDGVTTVYYRCEIHPTQMKGQLPVQ